MTAIYAVITRWQTRSHCSLFRSAVFPSVCLCFCVVLCCALACYATGHLVFVAFWHQAVATYAITYELLLTCVLFCRASGHASCANEKISSGGPLEGLEPKPRSIYSSVRCHTSSWPSWKRAPSTDAFMLACLFVLL